MKRILLTLAVIGLNLGLLIAITPPVLATTCTNSACSAVQGGVDAGNVGGGPTLSVIVTDVVDTLSVIVGLVAVIMIIYAGFRYMTSGGDSGSISSAKNTLIYAIVGLVVVAMAQFIVQFVLAKVT